MYEYEYLIIIKYISFEVTYTVPNIILEKTKTMNTDTYFIKKKHLLATLRNIIFV